MTTPTSAPPPYPLRADEAQRLQAVLATGLLDTPPEVHYDDLTTLAAYLCQAPVALITLLDKDRQWFKAAVGTDVRETPRSAAFCNHVVATGATTIIPDAAADPRFASNIFVTGEPHVRFYAGAPLITTGGHTVGSLCVLDTQPRQLTEQQIRALESLARQAEREIQMRSHVRELQQFMRERDQAQEAIRASESVLRAFYDSAPFMMGVVELRGDDTYHIAINRAAAKFAGHENTEKLINRSAADFGSPPEIIQLWVRHYRESLRTNAPVHFEYLQPTPSGQHNLSVTVSPIVHSESQFPRFSYVIENVTDARRAEQARAASEARLQYALDATEEGLYDWDFVTGEVFYSARCAQQLGYPTPDTAGTIDGWKAACHPEDLERATACLQAHCDGLTPTYEDEYRCRHADGHYIWLLSRGKVVKRDPDGRPLRMVGTTLDVSPRKEAEQELRVAKEEAQSASAAKSRFLANMSHEIRTPMTAILGFADLLEDPALAPADRQAYIQTIRRNGRHLLKLINDILDLSKIEADKLQVEEIDCPLAPLIFECVGVVRAPAAQKQLAVTVDYPSTLPVRIATDPTRVRQILTNLLANAVKFTDEGSVRLVVRSHTADDRDFLTFEVIDTGIGMKPDEAARLFQPFTQADASTTRKFGGTGLGLAISRRLARRMGGDITVTSDVGRGSTFTFTLPLHGVTPGTPPATPEPETPPLSPLALAARAAPLHAHILFAEDGPDNQLLISQVLRRAGATVTLADNGRSAVDKILAAHAAGTPFDLILMDMQMPEMDGYDATRLLRTTGILTPIIALTASAMDGDRRRCLAAGCTDFATKPIDVPELLAILRSRLSTGDRTAG